MSHIFISYSKKNKVYAYALADYLQAHGFDIWIDRVGIDYGVSWWDAIVEGLEKCSALVVIMAPESLRSDWVQREVFIALQDKKPVLPLLLNGDNWKLFVLTQYHDVRSGAMPDNEFLERLSYYVTPRGKGVNKWDSMTDLSAFRAETRPAFDIDEAIARFGAAYKAKNWSEALHILGRIRASQQDPTPFDPNDFERRVQLAIEEERRERERVAYDVERERQYRRVVLMTEYADADTIWVALKKVWAYFPDYDPENLARFKPLPIWSPETAASGSAPVILHKPRSIDLLPAPFAWIDIPGEKGKTWKSAPYKIGKYPVTNAQFRLFIEAGGYSERHWWTEAGWAQCKKEKWTEPRNWSNKYWNSAEQPVMGVSWFEAVAFCFWFSETTDEKIMLPTEDQWQYAAQGDDGREFPWGDEWDCGQCNNSVAPCQSGGTTSVRYFEGKGDSFFGVVDMAGNVQEWCLTSYDNKLNKVDKSEEYSPRRGGDWGDIHLDRFRCFDREESMPRSRVASGFRLARS